MKHSFEDDSEERDRREIAEAVTRALGSLKHKGCPVLLVNPTINIQVNYASGGGATVNVNRSVERDCRPSGSEGGFIVRLVGS